jgi:hypothetical protein
MSIQTSFLGLAGGGNARGAAGIAQAPIGDIAPTYEETHTTPSNRIIAKWHLLGHKTTISGRFKVILSNFLFLNFQFSIIILLSAALFSSCSSSADEGTPPPIEYRMATGGVIKYADSSGSLSDLPDADTVSEIHLFTASDSLVVTTAPATHALVTAIAGGGGAGGLHGTYVGDYAGGGGGGGFQEKPVTLAIGTYTITIGAGGAGGATGGDQGTNGGNTVLASSDLTELIVTIGGGGGGAGSTGTSNLAGKEGGSGGGGGNGDDINAGVAGTASQGNAGGAAVSGSNNDPGAGGGGAGGAGQDSAAGGGLGGLGIEIELLSALLGDAPGTFYASGGKGGGNTATPAIDGEHYGDGGGGACYESPPSVAVQGMSGHAGVLYIVIPYTPPAPPQPVQ